MAVAITAQSSGTSLSLSSSISFTGQAIGAAATDRLVVVGVAFYSDFSAAIETLTIGGISATKLATHAIGGALQSTIWAALVPTGTTATLVFGSQGSDVVQGLVWEAYSVTGANTSSPSSASITQTGSNGSVFATLALPTNGGIIGVAITNGSVTTWTNLTRDLNITTLASTEKATVASTITQGGSVTMTSSAGTNCRLLMVNIVVPSLTLPYRARPRFLFNNRRQFF